MLALTPRSVSSRSKWWYSGKQLTNSMRPTRTGAESSARPAAAEPPERAAPAVASDAVAIVPPHDVVERVALHRDAAGDADDAHQLSFAERLRGVDAGRMADLLLDHRSVEVVDAEHERDLGQLEADIDPEGLDMAEVVEHQAADGEHPEIVETRWPGELAEPGVSGLERERDEGVEAAAVVLQLAQPEHVVGELGRRLDVAVEHRRVRLEADRVRGAHDVEPLPAADLALADEVAHAPAKHLGATAGQ